MTSKVIEDYLVEVRTALALPSDEADAAIQEMRLHLEEDAKRRQLAQPKLGDTDAALAATAAFGDPREIANARLPGIARPRGSGRSNPWRIAGVAIAAAVLVGAFVAAWIVSTHLGGVCQDCGTVYTLDKTYAHESSWQNDSFSVAGNQLAGTFSVSLRPNATTAKGCVDVRLFDPGGHLYKELNECDAGDRQVAFHESGIWNVSVHFRNFTGDVHIEAHRDR